MARDRSKVKIHYVGQLKSPASWARVGRELVLALDRLGADISASGARGFLHDPDFPLPKKFQEILSRPQGKDVILTFTFPPNYGKLSGAKKTGILVYETTAVPRTWVEAINHELSLLVVPSSFTRDIMIRSGVRPELVEIVPHGFDPEKFHPGAAPAPRSAGDNYTFLSLAVPHKRKGTELLLDAFVREFSGSEPVALVLHAPYAPAPGKEKPWETPDIRVLVDSARNKSENPPRIVAEVGAIPDKDVPSLIAACDCYVQPSMSEGFGMAILEAMAMEKPVISTGWGGQTDFCSPENSYVIDYDIVPAGKVQYDNDDPDAEIALPKTESLRARLRRAFSNPSEARELGGKAAVSVRNLTWIVAAEKLLNLLNVLENGKV
ncbi:MAG: glycosyltransferase family 4 protein [Planctomycetota bacterium]